MRKVILSIFITLDGFIEGPNKEIDWHIGDEEMQKFGDNTLNAVDTISLGRVSYQVFVNYWPTATGDSADIINTLPKIVFSRTLDNAPWGKWDNARLVKDHISEEISQLKQQPGKDMVLFAGADIAQTFMRLGLIDEYRLLVHPVVLRSGNPLFDRVEKPFDLDLLRTQTFKNGVVVLYYEPAKPKAE